MAKKFAVIIILFSILASIIPQHAFGLIVPPDIGSKPDEVTKAEANIKCTGPWWTKIACVAAKVARYMKTVLKITKAISYVPHSFPFGGPILSSERACSFKFNSVTWIPNPLCLIGACFPPTIPIGPIPIPIPLGGRAIVVGPPVPTYPKPINPLPGNQIPPGGKVIAFPWISRIYRQHTENRAGPWALGLGFTPFPLKDINDGLSKIIIWIPFKPLDPPCLVGGFYPPYIGECVSGFRFDCSASGERDRFGNDIYKVIRLLGTSKENAPASAFPKGYTLPLK